MKKLTKILFIIFILTLIPAIFLGKFVVAGIVPVDNKLTFNFDVKAIIGLCLIGIITVLGLVLFFKFLGSLPLDKVLFFTSAPIVLIYGLLLFFLAYLNSVDNNFANAIKSILNITENNTYNLILWVIIISIVFIMLLFLNFIMVCRPVSKMERVVSRLGDGLVRNGRLIIGGGKQFNNIEHSLNKINNNFRESEGDFGPITTSKSQKFPKQFFKILGRSGVIELEHGNEVRKRLVLMGLRLQLSDGDFDTINSYFNLILPVIRRYGGFIDKYVGDGATAVFGKNENAIECSHAICRVIEARNRQNRTFTNVDVRISIVSENVVIGVTKINDRKVPSIVSQTDSLKKLDEICKFMSTKAIFSKGLIDELPLDFRFKYRYIGKVNLSGKDILLYEDLEVYDRHTKEKLFTNRGYFEKGIIEYENENYKQALFLFEEALKNFSGDKSSYVYYGKAKEKLE